MLMEIGFDQCVGDEGCFTLRQHDSRKNCKTEAIIGTHVDDMLAVGPPVALDKAESGIEGTVELDKRGKPTKMLGRMELTWEQDQVILTQTSLIESLAKQHLMKERLPQLKTSGDPSTHGKGSSIPQNPKLYEQEEDTADQKTFQSIVGGLLFVARMSRPEISVPTNLLGRRASKPEPSNLQAPRQLLEYLYSTRYEGIILRKPVNLDLRIYADAKYGGEKAKSQTGVLITLGQQSVG